MYDGPITKEQVFAAADRINESGKNPTQDLVRKALGGGSFSTISPYLKEWRKQMMEKAPVEVDNRPAPPEIIDLLGEWSTRIWALANEKAKAEFDEERESLQANISEVQSSYDEAASFADQLTGENEQLQEIIKERDALIQKTEEEKRQFEINFVAAQERANAAEARASEFQQRIQGQAEQIHRLEEEIRAERVNAKEASEVAFNEKTLRISLETEMEQVKRAVEELKGRLAASEKRSERLENERDKAIKESSDSAALVGQLRGELEGLKKQVAQQEEFIKTIADLKGRPPADE